MNTKHKIFFLLLLHHLLPLTIVWSQAPVPESGKKTIPLRKVIEDDQVYWEASFPANFHGAMLAWSSEIGKLSKTSVTNSASLLQEFAETDTYLGFPIISIPIKDTTNHRQVYRIRLWPVKHLDGNPTLTLDPIIDSEASIRAASLASQLTVEAREAANANQLSRAYDLLERSLITLTPQARKGESLKIQAALTEISSLAHLLHRFDIALSAQKLILLFIESHGPKEYWARSTTKATIAMFMAKQNQVFGARKLCEAAVQELSRLLPECHPSLYDAKRNLANIYIQVNHSELAFEIEKELVRINELCPPEDEYQTVTAKANLAGSLRERGHLTEALTTYRQVFEYFLENPDEPQPSLTIAKLNLASVLYQLGQLAEAQDFAEQAYSDALSFINDPTDSILLMTRGTLANILQERGFVQKALPLLKETYWMYKNYQFSDLGSLIRAGKMYSTALLRSNDLSESQNVLEEIMFLEEKHSDEPRSVSVINNYLTLASIQFQQGNVDHALRTIEKTIRWYREILDLAHPAVLKARSLHLLILSHKRDLKTLETEWPRFARDCRQLLRTYSHKGSKEISMLSATPLKYSSRSLNILQKVLINSSEWGAFIMDAFLLTEEIRLFGRMTQHPQNILEHDLYSMLGPAEEQSKTDSILKSGQAYVSYWTYLDQMLSPQGELSKVERRMNLCAFVLLPDNQIHFVPLGSTDYLRNDIHKWRLWIAGSARSSSRGIGGRKSDDNKIDLSQKISDKVLGPILPLLQGSQEIIFAFDEELFDLPFKALPIDSQLLGDRFQVQQVSSLFEIQHEHSPTQSTGTAILIGNIDYGEMEVIPTPDDPNSIQFESLPKTDPEIREIRLIMKRDPRAEVITLQNDQATVSKVKNLLPGKKLIHLATHTFLEPEISMSKKEILRQQSFQEEEFLMTKSEKRILLSPLELSGLALSGANKGLDSVGKRQGILTAEEISELDLSSCELVVLSACNTASGPKRDGQGAYSLQRAFHMAGAKAVISSLWKVEDQATERLMVEFYRRYLEENQPASQALWEAQLWLRDEGTPMRDWAGWILTGSTD